MSPKNTLLVLSFATLFALSINAAELPAAPRQTKAERVAEIQQLLEEMKASRNPSLANYAALGRLSRELLTLQAEDAPKK